MSHVTPRMSHVYVCHKSNHNRHVECQFEMYKYHVKFDKFVEFVAGKVIRTKVVSSRSKFDVYTWKNIYHAVNRTRTHRTHESICVVAHRTSNRQHKNTQNTHLNVFCVFLFCLPHGIRFVCCVCNVLCVVCAMCTVYILCVLCAMCAVY